MFFIFQIRIALSQLCLQGFPMKFRVTCFYPLLTPRVLPSLRTAGYAVILVLRNAESNRDGYRSYICTYVFHISDSDRTFPFWVMRFNFFSHIFLNDGSNTDSSRSRVWLCLQGFPMKFRVTCFRPTLASRELPTLRNVGRAVTLVPRDAESNRDRYRSCIFICNHHISDSGRTKIKEFQKFFRVNFSRAQINFLVRFF